MAKSSKALNVPLLKAIRLARINETLENYVLAGGDVKTGAQKGKDPDQIIYDERNFWNHFFDSPELYWNKLFSIRQCILSLWVPRIPGLFHTKSGRQMREQGYNHQAGTDKEFKINRELLPIGKSGVVLGGIGTFLFPPDIQGNQLVTLSLSYNASSGIPALISESVLATLKLKEGDLLKIKKAKWCKMSIEWAQRFPSIREIKRGYFSINNPEDVEVLNRNIPMEIHPCSIMEYESKEGVLFDYVFVTVDSQERRYRKLASDFFEYYRTKEGRNGKFLIAADIAEPLFDSKYVSPESLRSDAAGLNLIRHRINGLLIGGNTIDEMINVLSKNYSSIEDIKLLCTHLKLPKRILGTNKPAEAIHEVVNYCIEHEKVDEMVDFLVLNK
jgi:hypothetical protein